jgi:undecaprenyl-diphosphatase
MPGNFMLKYIFLGIVQGLTEFFPVSSSAHLVILGRILQITDGALALAVVLHLGTALALVVFFFRDILCLLRSLKQLLLVALVTVLTGAIALSGRDFFERLFSSPRAAAFSLLITAGILFLTKFFSAGKKERVAAKEAAALGLAQGIAVVPGISRSGITISTLLFLGIERQEAFRFSFLAAIPAIFGAALLEAEVTFAMAAQPAGFIIGFICSFFSGLAALWLLKYVIRKARLHYFAVYCMIAAAATLIFIK